MAISNQQFGRANKTMSYDKESLKKISGGDKMRTTYKVPTIKFNGNTGILTKFPLGDFKNGTDLTDVELVIMRPRRTFSSFEKISKTENIRMFTNEHNTWKDHVTVFEAKTDKRIKAVGSGSIDLLRNEFPSLRINSNLYCLYDGEVHKLTVKGKSRQSLVDKQKELAKDGLEFFEKKIKLVPKQETGTGGNMYFFLNYEVAGDSDLNVVGPHMENIAKAMDKIDEEYAETNKRMSEEATALTGADDNEDIIPIEETTKDEAEDEIKIEEIPF